MQDQDIKWAEFHSSLPDELLYPKPSSSPLTPLVEWPSGIFASWHYWKYLDTQNPYHGLHVCVILKNHPAQIPKNLLIDSVYQTWVHAKNLNSRKNSFLKASNEFLLLLVAQQLNIICGKPLEDCFIRVMAKSDSLNRPFTKASTFKQTYLKNKRKNPVFQSIERVLTDLVATKSIDPSDDLIDDFLDKFPITSKIGIVGSIYD